MSTSSLRTSSNRSFGWEKAATGITLGFGDGAADREYVVGEQFTSAGLTVSVHYSDDTTATLAENQYLVSVPDTSEIGVHTVTVEYTNQDIYATYTILVIPDVDWTASRMAAMSGGNELALFVTYRSGDTAYGYWTLKGADGGWETQKIMVGNHMHHVTESFHSSVGTTFKYSLTQALL